MGRPTHRYEFGGLVGKSGASVERDDGPGPRPLLASEGMEVDGPICGLVGEGMCLNL